MRCSAVAMWSILIGLPCPPGSCREWRRDILRQTTIKAYISRVEPDAELFATIWAPRLERRGGRSYSRRSTMAYGHLDRPTDLSLLVRSRVLGPGCAPLYPPLPRVAGSLHYPNCTSGAWLRFWRLAWSACQNRSKPPLDAMAARAASPTASRARSVLAAPVRYSIGGASELTGDRTLDTTASAARRGGAERGVDMPTSGGHDRGVSSTQPDLQSTYNRPAVRAVWMLLPDERRR